MIDPNRIDIYGGKDLKIARQLEGGFFLVWGLNQSELELEVCTSTHLYAWGCLRTQILFTGKPYSVYLNLWGCHDTEIVAGSARPGIAIHVNDWGPNRLKVPRGIDIHKETDPVRIKAAFGMDHEHFLEPQDNLRQGG